MIRWEDAVLRYLQNRQRKNYPFLGLILPIPDDDASPHELDQVQNQSSRISDTLSTTRILCGALLLPTFSSIIGRVFFDNVKNNLHRTLLGGIAFIAVKGAFKIYFKQKQYVRKKQRKIIDYTEENVRKYRNQHAHVHDN